MWTGTPDPSTRRCTSRPSAMVRAIGFSQKTGRPASTAARMSGGWASVAAATTTPSTPAASSASGVSAGSAPSRPATSAVTAGTASLTTRESTTGRSVRVWAWNAPIRPSPIKPRRMVGSLLSVQAAEDVLVPVDDRSGDDTAAVREQEDHEVGDLVDLAELAHREGAGRPLPPGVVGGVEGALGGVLALGLGPADVEAVDPDPVPAVGVGGVAGQAGQAGLGRDVGGQIRLTAQLGGGDDVDDRALRLVGQHVLDGGLHQEERRPQVDRDVGVEQLRGGVQQGASCGQPGRVDQAVDPAEGG